MPAAARVLRARPSSPPVVVRQYYKAAPPGTRMLEYECTEGMWAEHEERRGIRTGR